MISIEEFVEKYEEFTGNTTIKETVDNIPFLNLLESKGLIKVSYIEVSCGADMYVQAQIGYKVDDKFVSIVIDSDVQVEKISSIHMLYTEVVHKEMQAHKVISKLNE